MKKFLWKYSNIYEKIFVFENFAYKKNFVQNFQIQKISLEKSFFHMFCIKKILNDENLV